MTQLLNANPFLIVMMTVLVPAVVFGAVPQIIVRLIAQIYPPDDPRRDEMISEIEVVPFRDRVTWCLSQLARGACEAVPARLGNPTWKVTLRSAALGIYGALVGPVILVSAIGAAYRDGPAAVGAVGAPMVVGLCGFAAIACILSVGAALQPFRRRVLELMLIVDGELAHAEAESWSTKLSDAVMSSGGSIEGDVDWWGRRLFVVPIEGRPSGYYLVARIAAREHSVVGLDHCLQASREVMRHKLVRLSTEELKRNSQHEAR